MSEPKIDLNAIRSRMVRVTGGVLEMNVADILNDSYDLLAEIIRLTHELTRAREALKEPCGCQTFHESMLKYKELPCHQVRALKAYDEKAG